MTFNFSDVPIQTECSKTLYVSAEASPTLAGLLDVACKPSRQQKSTWCAQDSCASSSPAPSSYLAPRRRHLRHLKSTQASSESSHQVTEFRHRVSKQESTATDRRLRLQIKSDFSGKSMKKYIKYMNIK